MDGEPPSFLQKSTDQTPLDGAPIALNLRALYPGGDRDIAITPDGSRIVYRGNNQLLVRALDQLRAHGAERPGRTARRFHFARRAVGSGSPMGSLGSKKSPSQVGHP